MQEPGSASASTDDDNSNASQQPAEEAPQHLSSLFRTGADTAAGASAHNLPIQETLPPAAPGSLFGDASISTAGVGKTMQGSDFSSEQLDAYQHQSPAMHPMQAESHGLDAQHGTSAEPSHHVSLLQQQLRQSQDKIRHLEAAVSAHELEQATHQQRHDQQLRSATQQHQQQMQLQQQRLSHQQAQAAQQLDSAQSRADSLQQQMQAAQQQAHSLQQQLQAAQQQAQTLQQQVAQQQHQLDESRSSTTDLEGKLHAAQQQLHSAQDALASQLAEADSYTKQQLDEQQQAVEETQQVLRSTQAELRSTNSELEVSRQKLLAAQQQAETSQQRLADRDAVWQEELQQQQAGSQQLQLVRHHAPQSKHPSAEH